MREKPSHQQLSGAVRREKNLLRKRLEGSAGLEFVGGGLPRILFFAGRQASLHTFLETENLIEEGEIATFVWNRQEAALTHGLRVIRRELIDRDPAELALQPDFVIRDQETYLLILFPHESTKLHRWVRDYGAHQEFDIGGTFRTDQTIGRENILIVGSREVANDKENIMAAQYPTVVGTETRPQKLPPEKQTRKEVMKMFGLRQEDQAERFADLKERSRILRNVQTIRQHMQGYVIKES